MKKILISTLGMLFMTASAFAASVGVSGTALYYSASGTETTKSSAEKNDKSDSGFAPMASVFVEQELGTGVTVGLDVMPYSAKIGSGSMDKDDDAETSGTNKVDVNFKNHVTLYAEIPTDFGGIDGGFIKLDVVDQDIVIRMKNIQLGEPTIREANGSEHPSTPMECRLRKLTYMSPVTIDFQIVRNGVPSPKEEGVQVGSMPIMVRSKRCNLHPAHIAGDRQLYPTTSAEDAAMWDDLLRKRGEDPLERARADQRRVGQGAGQHAGRGARHGDVSRRAAGRSLQGGDQERPRTADTPRPGRMAVRRGGDGENSVHHLADPVGLRFDEL